MADKPIKLLFATRTSPFAGESGSGAYVFDLLRHLARAGFRIRVVWTEPPDLNPSHGWYAPPSASRGVFGLEVMDTVRIGGGFWKPDIVWPRLKARSFHALKHTLRRLHLWVDRRPPDRTPAQSATGSAAPIWGASATPSETEFVGRAIGRWSPDVAIANYAWMAPAMRACDTRHTPFAVLTHDVRHRQLHLCDGRLVEEFGEHTSIDEERRMLTNADALIAIQKTEAAVFSRLFPGKSVVTARMSAHFRPLPQPTRPALLFVGSGHGANRAGLFWFFEHVWPLVRRNVPAARLLVAGGISASITGAVPGGVVAFGRMDDLSSAYAQASVVIAPILKGSGLKIKVLEAISFGRICVTTSVGAEGFEDFLPAICIADTPIDFANATVSLLTEPALVTAGRESQLAHAHSHLSAENCYAPVASLLRSLSLRSP